MKYILLTLGDMITPLTTGVRKLGASCDSMINMRQQFNCIYIYGYAQLRYVGHLRCNTNRYSYKYLIDGLVGSRLDYCNALLYDVSETMVNKLRRIQNTVRHAIINRSAY